MCLGIPGQVVEFIDAGDQLAKVDVVGVKRNINVGLVRDEGLDVGDWVLIHVGFAMSIIDEQEAEKALAGLEMMGQVYTDELKEIANSRIE